jgi:tripeptidyl-peptidase-1
MRVGQPGSGNGPKTTGVVSNSTNQLQDCDKQITPICLRALYGLNYEPLSGDKNSYGIGEYRHVFEGASFDARYPAHSRVYPSILPPGRSQPLCQELLLGPLWREPHHGFHRRRYARLSAVTFTVTNLCTPPGSLSTEISVDINGESSLDLEYAMNMVTSKQKVTLYQVGDMVAGLKSDCILLNLLSDKTRALRCIFEQLP